MEGEPSGRRTSLLLAGVMILAALLVAAGSAGATRRSGGLDPDFGDGGRVLSDFPMTFLGSELTSIVREPDGKLLLGADVYTHVYPYETGAIERRLPNGKPDPSFGKGGSVSVPALDGLALQGDGSILYGVSNDPGRCRREASLHRLEPAGEPSFVGGPLPLAIERLAVQPDGKVILAGQASYGACGRDRAPHAQLALVRLDPDGSLDTSFSTDGIVEAHADYGLPDENVDDMVLAEDGDILVAGSSSLLRFLPNGALDPSFGEAGRVRPPGLPGELLALPGGGALLAGPSASASTCCRSDSSDFLLSRFAPDGSLDPSFGAGGTATLDLGRLDSPTALALGAGGTILLAGSTGDFGGCPRHCEIQPIIARFTAGGELDLGFGTEGRGFLSPSIPYGLGEHFERVTRIDSLAVGPDGRILAVGGGTETSYGFLATIPADGSPGPGPPGSNVRIEIRKAPSSSEATGLVVEPSGQIVLAAESDAGERERGPILAVFRPDGSPNRDVGGGGFKETEAEGPIALGDRDQIFSIVRRGKRKGVMRVGNRGRLDRAYGEQGFAPLPAGFLVGSLLAQGDGRVLVLGRAAHRRGMAVFRLSAAGRPEGSFGHGGLAVARFDDGAEAKAALVEPDGRIILVGRVGGDAAAARLLPDGHLDRGFGRHGRLGDLLGEEGGATTVVVQPDGGLLVGCTTEGPDAGSSTALVRLGPRGRRDRSFGHGGVLRVGGWGTLLSLFSSRRRIVTVSTLPGGRSGVRLRAYRRDGGVDRSFGRDGVETAAARQRQVFRPSGAGRQPGGRIVVAGTAGVPGSAGSRLELLGFR